MSRAWMAKVWDYMMKPDVTGDINTDKNKSTTYMLCAHVLKVITFNLTSQHIVKKLNLDFNTVGALFRTFLSKEYGDMIYLKNVHWSYELQIRVGISLVRVYYVFVGLFGLRYINYIFWDWLTYKLLHCMMDIKMKDECNYLCRFRQFCQFGNSFKYQTFFDKYILSNIVS